MNVILNPNEVHAVIVLVTAQLIDHRLRDLRSVFQL